MKHAKKISAMLIDKMLDAIKSTAAFSCPVLGIVIQDNFSANRDRSEFMQDITGHAITSLRRTKAGGYQ